MYIEKQEVVVSCRQLEEMNGSEGEGWWNLPVSVHGL